MSVKEVMEMNDLFWQVPALVLGWLMLSWAIFLIVWHSFEPDPHLLARISYLVSLCATLAVSQWWLKAPAAVWLILLPYLAAAVWTDPRLHCHRL